MAFLVVVVSTRFILANEEYDEIRKDIKNTPVYDMVSKAHGNLPVIPIKTQYIILVMILSCMFLKVKEKIMIYLG